MSSALLFGEGLWLEAKSVLVPWLTPKQMLMSLGFPTFDVRGTSVELQWAGPGLGGFEGLFKTHLGDGDLTGPAAWYVADRLVYWDFQYLPTGLTERDKFDRLAAHLVHHIGEAAQWVDEYDLPNMLWEQPGYSLSLAMAERFGGGYCSFRISHASHRHMTFAQHGPNR
jgi:hypothetical protein